MTYMIDTAAAIRKLEDAGCDSKVANAIVETLGSVQGELATKADIEPVRKDLENQRFVLEGKIDALASKTDSRFDPFETKMDGSFDPFETNMDGWFDALETKMKWTVVLAVLMGVVIVKALDYLLPAPSI